MFSVGLAMFVVDAFLLVTGAALPLIPVVIGSSGMLKLASSEVTLVVPSDSRCVPLASLNLPDMLDVTPVVTIGSGNALLAAGLLLTRASALGLAHVVTNASAGSLVAVAAVAVDDCFSRAPSSEATVSIR